MSKTLQHLIAATLLALGLFASTAQAQVVIATDDFSADTVSIDNRLRLENTTDDWVAFPDTLWTVANGTLGNAGTTPGVPSEGGLLQVIAVGTQPDSTMLTFSFDYTVGTGSTLYFHTVGLHAGTTLGG